MLNLVVVDSTVYFKQHRLFNPLVIMKKLPILVLILLPLFGFTQANKFIRKGQRATDPQEKISFFSEAIKLDPENLNAYFYRGITRDNIGDHNGAIMDYTKVIFFSPSADVYFNRGNSKYSLMNYIGAKEDFEKAIELDTSFTQAKYSLAVTKFNLEDYKGTILDLKTMNPKTANILILLGQSYEALDDYKNALLGYTSAVLNSPDTQTFYARGLFYMEINYYKNANDDFTMAASLDNTNVPAFFFKAVSHYFLGEFDQALNYFSQVYKYDSTDIDAAIGLALTYYHLKNLPNSKLYFQKAKNLLKKSALDDGDGINLFKDTYWFEKQLYALKKDFEALDNL